MKKKFTITFLYLLVLSSFTLGQSARIQGVVFEEGRYLEFAQVSIDSLRLSTYTDSEGQFIIDGLPLGTHNVNFSFLGHVVVDTIITLSQGQSDATLSINLQRKEISFDEVVVTGTKTFKRQTNSPIIVNIVESKTLDLVQACNLSEGLRFQPGLRVETDCQTCNYTQLRMNGLAGGYSQVLINGRPIFSPLTGLYGLEQLPNNMIDRIEVVRGGGSTLYGSSAIAGTVNVITKLPKHNSYEVDYTYQNIDGQTHDHQIQGNISLVANNEKSGISLFINQRNRGFFDANGDKFSELPLLENTSFGGNIFVLPRDNQKLELSISNLNEYRFGGEMITDLPAHFAQQAEERTHNVWMASADYQINFNQENSSLITYLAWQNTDRTHYTGIQPEVDTPEFEVFLDNLPYGTSDVQTINAGLQFNHRLRRFITGSNVITLGAEYIKDEVFDKIDAYNYLIDQTTHNVGAFLQSDWSLSPRWSILSGVRWDKHNLIDGSVVSPRVSLLYRPIQNGQWRLNYGSGFRAPQAFDTDLHIAFAGGGVSRVRLSPMLQEERSHSVSTSFNYDKITENWIAGFTVEGFYNRLRDAFILQPVGEDGFGEVFEKQNGDGASVWGTTIEVRTNIDKKMQLEGGLTLQRSRFDEPVNYIEGVAGITDFVRTPNEYGYAVMTYMPTSRWNATLNYVYTGSMLVPHFAGAPNQFVDEIFVSNSFSEWSLKLAYTLPIRSLDNRLELYGGIKNITNAYQNDFDLGKNRDSNYIYGPALPRTFFLGLKMAAG